jgi:hypothetical protein
MVALWYFFFLILSVVSMDGRTQSKYLAFF